MFKIVDKLGQSTIKKCSNCKYTDHVITEVEVEYSVHI